VQDFVRGPGLVAVFTGTCGHQLSLYGDPGLTKAPRSCAHSCNQPTSSLRRCSWTNTHETSGACGRRSSKSKCARTLFCTNSLPSCSISSGTQQTVLDSLSSCAPSTRAWHRAFTLV
jgi:hypothetical protein